MAQKKNYSRYFIILNEDEKGYAIASDKLPTGYVKLEVKNNKCKVSYYVQNLKREAAPYYMILVLGKKDINKLIKIGELNIDDFGRADVSYEYASDNVGDTGMDVDSVSGASVARMIDSNIKPVLSGFLTSDIPKWRDYIIIEPKNREEEVEEEITPVSIFDEYEESIEQRAKAEEVQEIEEIEDTVEVQEVEYAREDIVEDIEDIKEVDNERGDIEDIVEEMVEIEDDKEAEGIREIVEDNAETRHKDEKKNRPKCKMGKFFDELAKDYDEVKGEISEIKNCNWYKVPAGEINSMNCPMHWNKYSAIYSPMVNYHNYIMAHKYYLVGYKYDKEGKMKCLIYGIPGSKSKMDQPYGGKTGFVTWVSSKSRKCEGYWLMFYDFKTSTILIPVK